MRTTLLALLLCLPATAHAISGPMAGYYLEVGPSLSLNTTPFHAPAGGSAGLGWWKGKYDDSFAMGRWASLGASVQTGFSANGPLITPALDVRRGWDLLVAKPWFGATMGMELGPAGPGPLLTLGGGVKYRMNRFFGLHIRAQAGAAYVGGAAVGRFGLVLAADWAAPFRAVKR